MKTTITLFIALLIGSIAVAQNGINYKAIIKDGSGAIVVNQLIQVQFSILEDAAIVYTESHVPTTTANGLIILTIGGGTPVAGAFGSIDWANAAHYLNVQVNTGDGLVDMGTTEFAAVPYAITSGDVVFEKDGDDAFKNDGNIGIGTDNPTERLHIEDTDSASILLKTPSVNDTSALILENGDPAGTHTFFKIENRSDFIRIGVDSDFTSGTGYDPIVSISTSGDIATAGNITTAGSLRSGIGATIAEFSTDGTLSGNSNTAVPTEQAVKTYVDNASGGSKTIVIPATAFTGNQGNNNIVYRNSGTYAQYEVSNASLAAPLTLPVGSTITAITFYVRDNTNIGNKNLEVALLLAFRSSAIPSVLFTRSTFATDFEVIYNTPITLFADNQYFLRVRPTSTWDTELGIYSVKITYTE